jgi:hypothetical protein
MVSTPKADYCGCNDGYLKNSSYLKWGLYVWIR